MHTQAGDQFWQFCGNGIWFDRLKWLTCNIAMTSIVKGKTNNISCHGTSASGVPLLSVIDEW